MKLLAIPLILICGFSYSQNVFVPISNSPMSAFKDTFGLKNAGMPTGIYKSVATAAIISNNRANFYLWDSTCTLHDSAHIHPINGNMGCWVLGTNPYLTAGSGLLRTGDVFLFDSNYISLRWAPIIKAKADSATIKNYVDSINNVNTGNNNLKLNSSTAASLYYLASNPNKYISTFSERDSIGLAKTKADSILFATNKQDKLGFTPYNSNNPNGYISSVDSTKFTTTYQNSLKLSAATAASTYMTTTNALASFLTISNAASTYQPIGSYLTTSSAASTYLTVSNAIGNYYPLTGNPSGFLTSSALSPYQLISSVGTGVTDGSNASAGKVGEYILSSIAAASAVTLSNGVATNITSITLTAGDWDVTANANVVITLATVTNKSAGISTTSATMPTDGSEVYSGVITTLLSNTDGLTLATKRINITTSTTVYLVANCGFTAGGAKGYGTIKARRVR